MPTTTVLNRDATTITSEERRFNWGAAIAGAFAATGVTFFLLTLGSGIGLALVSAPRTSATGGTDFLALGAIYFLAVQAFGFAVGGYIVGRLIGPEVETTEEEEFRAAAHGFVMWALVIVVGLLLAGFSSVLSGSTISGTTLSSTTASSDYWTDVLFRPAPNTPGIAADKAEVGRILQSNIPKGGSLSNDDNARIAGLVSRDAGIPMSAATTRVTDIQSQMRSAASILNLWTAFALLLGALVAIAAAISSRWQDDRVTFSFRSRR